MISYTNSKGEKIRVAITNYSIFRMKKRYELLYRKPITFEDARKFIVKSFPCTDRVYNLKQVERKRVKKHPGATLYFRDSNFTFVVQDARLATVEISRKYLRHLNKEKKR